MFQDLEVAVVDPMLKFAKWQLALASTITCIRISQLKYCIATYYIVGKGLAVANLIKGTLEYF